MKPPTTVSELRRFLGMVNQLGKFSHNLAQITQPLRELLKKTQSWVWEEAQSQAFKAVKEELTKPIVLTLYDVNADTRIATDASSFGLGAVLLQKTTKDEWKPVAYASRSMTVTERRYAQIEKEALAITWGCERFSTYVLGKQFLILTDHKPLIPLLGTKQLDNLPPRILRFRLRLTKFQYSIEYTPGKTLYVPDTLSRAPLTATGESPDSRKEVNDEVVMEIAMSVLPVDRSRLSEYRQKQLTDPKCSIIMQYCQGGWPMHKSQVEKALQPYWEHQGNLTIGDGILLYDNRIVVPENLQKEVLKKIHEGHQGIEKCRSRAKRSVWWPGLSKQITHCIQSCKECSKSFHQKVEPLMPTKLPEYPWQQVGVDLFYFKGKDYFDVCRLFFPLP